MEIINVEGKYINILGTVNTPYFIGAEIGSILGFHSHTLQYGRMYRMKTKLHMLIRGVLRFSTRLNSSRLASY